MAKWGKRLLGLAAIGGAVAGLVYYLKNSDSSDTEDEFCDDLDDEDCDLDSDLKSVADREYVPLNSAQKSEENTEATDTPKEDETSAQ